VAGFSGRKNGGGTSAKSTALAKDGLPVGNAPVEAGQKMEPAINKAEQSYSLEDLFLFDPMFESCW
jgi:hypothetical protein